MKLPITFPKSPATGERRDLEDPALSLRIPIAPQPQVELKVTFVVGEALLGGEVKYQRPVLWLEAEDAGDPRFDFAVCGILVTGDEVKLQHGLVERPAPQHPKRLRARTGGRVEGGERVSFELTKTADGGASLVVGAAGSGPQRIAKPPGTRIVAIHVGLGREADFPTVGGQRDKTKPGAWQPLYGWLLEDLTVNGQAVFERGDEEPPSDGSGPEPVETPEPRLEALRIKLQAIRDLVDEALIELE